MPSASSYLGNKSTKEVHRLPGRPNCQIAEITRENRIRFTSLQAALRAGYDRCHWCLGESRR